MKRNEFLAQLGIGVAVACTSCLASCSKKKNILIEDDYLLKADLANELLFKGQSKTGNGVILVRTGISADSASFVATDAFCDGKAVVFNSNLSQFETPVDGSEFNLAGIITYGPAKGNLKIYNTHIVGNSLFVYAPGTAAPLAVPVNFSINLDSQLKAVNDFVNMSGVIVLRTTMGNFPQSFSAVQAACSHQGTTINFINAQNQFVCPNHGSIFTINGEIVQGPATRKLKQYKVIVNQNILNISEP